MLPGRRVPRRPREWGTRAVFIAVLFWLFGALLFATRLSILKRTPINSASAPKIALDAPSFITSTRRRLDTSRRHKTNNTTSPPPLPLATLPHIDQRVSNFGASLTPDSLNGGWRFTHKVYNHATQNLQENNGTIISWDKPRVVLFKNFLAPKEVEHLIKLAESGFQRSEVVSDSQVISQSRTSYGAWLNGDRRTDIVYQIQDRIAKVTGIPEAFGESLYVLRYEQGRHELFSLKQSGESPASPGLKDSFGQQQQGNGETLTEACRSFLKRAGGPGCGLQGGGETCGDRLATFIMYLKTPEQGGETVFPRAVLKKDENLNKDGKIEVQAEDFNLDKVLNTSGREVQLRSLIDDSGNSAGGGGGRLSKATLGQAEHGLGSLQKERMEIKNNTETTPPRKFDKDKDIVGNTDDGGGDIVKTAKSIDDTQSTEDPSLPWYCKKESQGQVLKVLPQAGDVVFFFNYIPGEGSDDLLNYNTQAVPDPTAAHGGCPPTKGTKMIATRWMRSSLFG